MQLSVPEPVWSQLRTHMNARRERAAFMFTQIDADGNAYVVDTWLLDDDSHYETRETDHLVLDDDVRAQVIARAHKTGLGAVEAHSHWWPGPSTRFSRYDLHGLAEFAPHMLWRLPGRPYIALVMGEDSFDGLWWSSRTSFGTLAAVVVGGVTLNPTGLSLDHYTHLQGGATDGD